MHTSSRSRCSSLQSCSSAAHKLKTRILHHQPRLAPVHQATVQRRPSLIRSGHKPPAEVAALEAAVGAINKVLAFNNRLKGGSGKKAVDARQQAHGGQSQSDAATRSSDPGKLVSFKAKASGARDVTELFAAHGASNEVLGAAAGVADAAPPGHSQNRFLRAYLSLPLEQYSLLDPRYISRLPADNSSAGSTTSSSGSSGSTSSGSTSSDSHAGGGSTGGVSPNSAAPEAIATDAGSQPPASGSFLLTIPLSDIVGLNLTPELTVDVDVDERKGQVTFTASKLHVGIPRMDADVELHMCARMSSSLKRKARLVEPHEGGDPGHQPGPQHHGHKQKHKHPHAHKHGVRAVSKGAIAQPGSSSTNNPDYGDASSGVAANHHSSSSSSSSSSSGSDGGVSGVGGGSSSSPTTSSGATDQAAADAPGTAAAPEVHMQQVSRLRCDVEVRLRVRIPPPLSAVPGPLLSTTGGLVAKLVMQALLPSFLDLLAVDYARWAAGDANRRTVAAGSLLPPASTAIGRDGAPAQLLNGEMSEKQQAEQ